METENKRQEIKKLTFRSASTFGFQLANNLAEQLEKENISPANWPTKFPVTFKKINRIPEVSGNGKIAKRVLEAARAIWDDMRVQAVEIEKDMTLHPEYYGIENDTDISQDTQWAWRHLSIAIEQTAGNLFVTEYENEDTAKANVYLMLSPRALKNFLIQFEDDYSAFTSEIRETIRNKKEVPASERFELICLINISTQTAQKMIIKDKKKKNS